MTEAVLFDWGGTLDDGAWGDEIALRATRAALEAIGRNEIDPPDVIRWLEINESLFRLESTSEVDLSEISRACLGAMGCRLTDDELERYMHAWQQTVGGEAQLHPDALRLLDALRSRGLRLGLISNTSTPGRFLTVHLDEQGLAQRFDVVVFSSDHGRRKPHPAIFRAALDQLGVAPEHAMFVGDRLDTDIVGARAAGMTTVHATWFRDEDAAEKEVADYVAHEPLEILDILDRCFAPTRS